MTADPAGGPVVPPADLLATLDATLERLRVFTEQLRAAAEVEADQ